MELKIEDFESRRGKGKTRHLEVKIICEECDQEAWKRWIRVKDGKGRFCSRKCANIAQRKWGREYAYFYYDKGKDRWLARWRDKKTGRTHVAYKSKFMWENEHGEVPEGFEIHHIDGDNTNDNLQNLEIMTIGEHKALHGSNRKMVDGVVHKQCFRCKDYYPEHEYVTSYCKDCHREYVAEWRAKKK